jgi:CRISPR-associated protein Cmr2
MECDMTEQYFFICSIGPVQGFVATARTSQDLWFGSWMLSELAKAVAKVLKDDGHTLIFPAPESDLHPDSAVSMANKVVAIVNGSPSVVGKQVWDAIVNRRNRLAKDSFDAVPVKFDRAEAQKQLEDLIEFYWAAVPYDADKGDNAYKEARSRAEALLAARKNTRNFRQVYGKVGLPKSSLDGFRESVLLDSGDIEDSSENLRVEKGESLSGVDLLKRWGARQGGVHFFSTTDIAVRPFERGIEKATYNALLADLKALRKKYQGKKETDGTHFYQDRLVQLLADKDVAADFRREFASTFEKYGIKHRPSPYYALLQADGDNMGKTIDSQKEQQQHIALSKALSTFATQAKGIIKQHDGVPVYVGGDDVLAYLPLHTTLDCVKELDRTFSRAMQNFTTEDGKLPTLSIGLAIAHHLTPLSDVLETTHEAERKAKRISGKNALAIISSKRGGVERTVSARMGDLLERMPVLIEYMRQKQISAGTAYEFQNLYQQLSDTGLPTEAFQREAIRIIQRKREEGGGREAQEQVRQKFKTWFEDTNLTLGELAQEMIIASEFAKAREMAEKEAQA